MIVRAVFQFKNDLDEGIEARLPKLFEVWFCEVGQFIDPSMIDPGLYGKKVGDTSFRVGDLFIDNNPFLVGGHFRQTNGHAGGR